MSLPNGMPTPGMTLRLLLPVIAAMLVGTPRAVAQEEPSEACGTMCDSCVGAGLWKEGKGLVPHGDPRAKYDMQCKFKFWGRDCEQCHPQTTASVAALASSHERLVRAIVAASSTELPGIIDDAARGQMVVDDRRQIVGFRGSGCASTSITSVIVVSPAKIAALRDLGVQSLDRFLAPIRAAK